MDIDNPNAKEDLQYFIWTWITSWIGSWIIGSWKVSDLIPDSLSWTVQDIKWYAHKYYEDTVEEYVDQAKQWLSWAVKSLKDYYNSWVDQLTNNITDKVSWAISWELKKIKL